MGAPSTLPRFVGHLRGGTGTLLPVSGPPSFLTPEVGAATLIEKPWGGKRLGRLRGGPRLAEDRIGESWEFSTLSGNESRVGGSWLSQVLGGPLPLLAKLLDTAEALSVQVHPDDDLHTGIRGKEEAWVILDADPGAVVWAGLRENVDPRDFEAHVASASADPATGDALLGDLRRIPVDRGTCVLIPAGTTHALGPGILLAEVQTPTDNTYRFFDYGRPRPLQVKQSLAAYRPHARPTVWAPGQSGPAALQGKHVALDVLEPGQTADRRAPHGPVVVIPVRGDVVTTDAHGGTASLSPGSLRLWIGPGTVTVGKTGLAVLGTVR